MKLILFIFYFLCSLNILAITAKAQVTSLKGSTRDVPFFTEIVRDPSLLKQKILDELTAEMTYEAWQKKQPQVKSAKGTQKLNLLSEQLNDSVRIVYYIEDLLLGRIVANSKSFKISIKQARLNVAKVANQIIKDKKASRALRARAIFHGGVTDYMNGRFQSSRIKRMAEVKGLNGFLSRRRDFMVAWHALRKGNKAQSDKAIREINGMIRSFPRLASVSMRLIIGRYHAGISTSGRKFTKSNSIYRKYFWAAADRMRTQSESDQEKVLKFITLAWSAAEGRSIKWSNPPFKMKSFPTSKVTFAVVERAADQDRRKGDFRKAGQKYEMLARSFEGDVKTKQFDDKLISLRESEYRKTKDSRAYEKTLIQKIAKYSASGVMGEKVSTESAKAAYEKKLSTLADREIRAAKSRRAKKVQRRQAVSMAQRVIESTENKQDKERYSLEIGYIYQIHGEHKKAVSQFMDMALNGAEESKYKYYSLAANSQRVLAKWPKKTPWLGFAKGPGEQRYELARMYESMYKYRPKDWAVVGHLGLLQIATGEKAKAIGLWSKAIESLNANKSAGYAAGFLLTEHDASSNWAGLESTARIVIKRKLTPYNMRKKLNANSYLATALLEGGKELLAADNASAAVKKLGEFTEKYRKHSRHDDGFYHYALALYKDKQHVKGIETIQKFAETYPRSKYHKPAMYNGSKWSISTAMEEKAIYFMQGYTLKYNSSEKAHEIRTDLIDLYQGKLLYRQISQVHLRTTQDKSVDFETKKQADIARLRIEMQHNSPVAAIKLADALIKKYKNDDELKMKAYGTKAIAAANKGDMKTLTSLERKMSQLSASEQESRELLGWVRYLRASMIGKKLSNEVVAITMKKPLKDMEDRYKTFLSMKKQFDAVCEGLQSSYCAGAMFDLAKISRESVKAFEDYSIAETLDKKIVDAFYSRKSSIIKSLTQISINANSKSTELATSGETQPSHVRRIMWYNSADWNFEGSDTENGHGFVQWHTADK